MRSIRQILLPAVAAVWITVDLLQPSRHSGIKCLEVALAEPSKEVNLRTPFPNLPDDSSEINEKARKKVCEALALDSPKGKKFLDKFTTPARKDIVSKFKSGDGYGGDGLHSDPLDEHEFSMLWFHGLAQPIDDYPRLLSILVLDENILRKTRFIVPQAPKRVVTCFPYGEFTAWADMPDFHPRGGEDYEGWMDSTERMCRILDGEADRISKTLNVSKAEASSRIVVGGISQGAALASSVSLSCPTTPGSTVVVAGWIPLAAYYPNILSDNLKNKRQMTEFLVLHGEDDLMVLPLWARLSFQGLKKVLSLPGKFLAYHGIGHEVCQEEVTEVQQFVTVKMQQSAATK